MPCNGMHFSTAVKSTVRTHYIRRHSSAEPVAAPPFEKPFDGKEINNACHLLEASICPRCCLPFTAKMNDYITHIMRQKCANQF
jgi:hypothetical protein